MNSIPQNMLHALRFTVKFGNLVYILITGLFVAVSFNIFYKQQFMQQLGKTYAFSMKAFLFFLAIAFIIFFLQDSGQCRPDNFRPERRICTHHSH